MGCAQYSTSEKFLEGPSPLKNYDNMKKKNHFRDNIPKYQNSKFQSSVSLSSLGGTAVDWLTVKYVISQSEVPGWMDGEQRGGSVSKIVIY